MVTFALLGILVLLFQQIFLHYAWRQQKSEEDKHEETDEEQEEGREEDSELSDEEWSNYISFTSNKAWLLLVEGVCFANLNS